MKSLLQLLHNYTCVARLCAFALLVLTPNIAEARDFGGSGGQRDAANPHVLATFVRLMMQFSTVDKSALDGEFSVCLSASADTTYQLSSLHGYEIHGNRISVRLASNAADIDNNCAIAFLTKTEANRVDYDALTKSGVLTISNLYDFARKGGVLEVEFHGDRIAFFVGRRPMRKTSFSPSSKFLRMATDIY